MVYINEFLEKNKKILINLLIIILSILFSYIFFNYMFGYIAPFIIGWILSLIFNPIVNFLEKKCHIKRSLGSLIAILLLIGFFSFIIGSIISKLISEAELFKSQLPMYIEPIKNVIKNIIESIKSFMNKIIDMIPFSESFMIIDTSKIQISDIITPLITPLIKTGSSNSFTIVKAIPEFLMIIIMAILSSYFFTKDKYKIRNIIKKYIPENQNSHWNIAKRHLLYSLGGYFKTQLILMCYTFIICLIGLFIIRSPYALLLSVIISIIDALPFFGSGFILWPASVMYLFYGEYYLAAGYIIIYLVINLIRQILQPKILGTQIGIHPLIALISMYIGLKLLGVLGMIIGPILAVIIKAFIEASEIYENNIDNE